MQFITHKHALLALTVILTLTACRKDKRQRPAENSKLLMKVVENANKAYRYEYTPDGKLSKQCYYAGFTTADTIFMYYAYKNGIPDKMTANEDETRFYYANGRMTRMEVHTLREGMQYYWQYRYDNGRLATEQGFEAVNGEWKANQQRVHTYDTEGRRVKKEFYSDDHHTGVFTKTRYVEYSGFLQHPDPVEHLAVLHQLPGRQPAPPLASQEAWFDGEGFEEYNLRFGYRFDGDGYPAERTMTATNPDGQVISRSTITYAYNR